MIKISDLILPVPKTGCFEICPNLHSLQLINVPYVGLSLPAALCATSAALCDNLSKV